MFLRMLELLFIMFLVFWVTIDILYPLVSGTPFCPVIRALFGKKTPGEASVDSAISQAKQTKLYREAKRIRNS